MATLDEGVLRKLADWDTNEYPVTSLYLHVDGRRHPRREDYLTIMEDLLKTIDTQDMSRDHRSSGLGDRARISAFVRDEFERDGIRGLAVFSCSGAELWEWVELPQPVRNAIEVGPRPRLIPLEAMLERFETFCAVVADREKARLFLVAQGRIEEIGEIEDDVPGRHDQGGWSQARYQRHIEDHVHRHLKRVAERVLAVSKRRPFDHLILAGTEELVPDLERELHDYVRRRVLERTTLPIGVGADEVLRRVIEVEEGLERGREAEALDRLAHEVASGTGRVTAGLGDTLPAVEAGRVETLVVSLDLQADGVRCPSCAHLELEGTTCPVCGSGLDETSALVEEVVESALRQRCRVETVAGADELDRLGGIGALLRY